MKVIPKPIPVEAVQFKGFMTHELEKHLKGYDFVCDELTRILTIPLVDCTMIVEENEWIIIEDNNDICSYSNNYFKKLFQQVS